MLPFYFVYAALQIQCVYGIMQCSVHRNAGTGFSAQLISHQRAETVAIYQFCADAEKDQIRLAADIFDLAIQIMGKCVERVSFLRNNNFFHSLHKINSEQD